MTKTIVIISGKGGTGKTSITACLALLAKKAVLADCDVDAADLHLLLSPKIQEEKPFISGEQALIDPEKCINCDKCRRACTFSAINETYAVNPIDCEGCAACTLVCPVNAITMIPSECGKSFISETRAGPMAHAKLFPGKENSGKLVSLVRSKAQELAKQNNANFILVDGPPGVGCPVIASIGNTDIALIVTEPTVSGVHDLKRALQLTQHFKINSAVLINKSDINEQISTEIEDFCNSQNIIIAGKIPYTTEFVKAQLAGQTIIEYIKKENKDEDSYTPSQRQIITAFRSLREFCFS
ncbi:MAG: ATP-binding protein [Pseudomonadota bacterium]